MPAGPILTLDLARRLGWAAGVPDARPRCGAVQLVGKEHGEVYAALCNWLEDAIAVHRPATVVFEAPLVRGDHAGVSAGRLALGMVAVVELTCWDKGVRCLEEHVGRTRKAVMGRGSFPKGTAKAEVMSWLAARGFDVTDDNAADALLLWLHAESVVTKRPAGALFQMQRAA